MMIKVQSLPFSSKYLSVKRFFQFFTTSRITTAATAVVPFCFQGQLWEGSTSTKYFFENASSKAFIQRYFLMKYGTFIRGFSFKTTVLNIFERFFERDQQQSS